MQTDFEMRIIEENQGFYLHHQIEVPSSENNKLRIQCSHKFMNKTHLDQLKKALMMPNEIELATSDPQKAAHNLALMEADVHLFAVSGSTIFTGTVHELQIRKGSIKFLFEFWDDGNVYRDIGPSGYRETWDVNESHFSDFLRTLGLDDQTSLMLRIEGPEHLEIRQHLQTYAKERNLYSKSDT
jgi:hypothetical protein